MSLRDFHNGLRILRSLDHHEVPFLSDDQWRRFADAPHDFFIRCDDDTAEKIWAAIEARMPASCDAANACAMRQALATAPAVPA